MRLRPPSARTAWRLCGLLGLLCGGCMPLGYVFPTVSYVRPASVGAACDQVRAFRVDVTDDDNWFEIPEHDRYVLTPLPLYDDGSFDPQVKVAANYGWFLNGLVAMYGCARRHTVLVRLYRPGYHTLELPSWRNNDRLSWTQAPTLPEQEQAIDDLVSTWWTAPVRVQTVYALENVGAPRDPTVFRYLASGSTSPEHQEALCFAAGEYQRLAHQATDAEFRSRLEEKANSLRQLSLR